MRKAWASEAALAAHVSSWLQAGGWDVYQEVAFHGRADLVGLKDGKVGVWECKLSFGLKVLDQASRWQHYADFSFVVVPGMGYKSGHEFGRKVREKFGIGCVLAAGSHSTPRVLVPAALNPSRNREIVKHLCPEQKTYAAAGTNRGGYWTPFKKFAAKLADLTKQKGCWSLQEASKHPDLQDNYASSASMRRCVPKLCGKGAIPGVEAVNVRGCWMLKWDPTTKT